MTLTFRFNLAPYSTSPNLPQWIIVEHHEGGLTNIVEMSPAFLMAIDSSTSVAMYADMKAAALNNWNTHLEILKDGKAEKEEKPAGYSSIFEEMADIFKPKTQY